MRSTSFFPEDINLGVLKSIGTTCAGMRGRVGAGACSAVGGRQHGRGPAGRVREALSRSGPDLDPDLAPDLDPDPVLHPTSSLKMDHWVILKPEVSSIGAMLVKMAVFLN